MNARHRSRTLLTVAAVTMLLGLAGRGQAGVITINNWSFEDPVLTDSDFTNPVSPWTKTADGSGNAVIWNPTSTQFTGASGTGTPAGADGTNVLSSYVPNGWGGVYQEITGAQLTAGQTYTLTVAVGWRKDQATPLNWRLGIKTPSMALGNYLASTSDSGSGASLTQDEFNDFSVQYTATGLETQIGENLQVWLWGNSTGGATHVAFDNVRLEEQAIPEPGASPYSSAVLADNPLGYYRMNETAGSTALDSAGTAQNGVYRNGITATVNPPTAGAPLLNQAGPQSPAFPGFEANNGSVFFDGVRAGNGIDFSLTATDNLNITTLSTLSDTDYTFEAWIYNTGVSGSGVIKGYIGGRGETSSNQDALGIMGTYIPAAQGKLFLFNGNTANQLITGSTVLAEDTWYHVAYTRSGTDVAVYLNGSLEVSSPGFTNSYGTNDVIRAAIQPPGLFALQGRIDELAIYSNALTGPQIAAHYNAASVVAEPVPEPSTFVMAAFGLCLWGLTGYGRRRRC